MLLGEEDGEIGDDGFACARRRGDEHVVPLLQRLIGLGLEGIKFEWQAPFELRRDTGVATLTLSESGITLGLRNIRVIRALLMMSAHMVLTTLCA